MRENPEAKKCDVIRGTWLDKKTVYKNYEAAKEKAQAMRGEPVIIAGTTRGQKVLFYPAEFPYNGRGAWVECNHGD